MTQFALSRRGLLKAACAGAIALPTLPRNLYALPDAVIKRTIPGTGEALAVMGLGTNRTFSHATPRQQLGAVLQAFFDHGGQFIDSSPMYGPAEALVGELLKTTTNASALFAATKVWTNGREAGMRQMAKSMGLMGVERMDLMQVHNLRDWKTHLKTLREMKEQGQIRYLGITTSHGRRHEKLEAIMKEEPLDFVQLSYNIVNRTAEERLLPLAADRGIATVINRPYQRGSLFRRVKGNPLPAWAGEIDCATWGQFFLKFIVGHPAVTCVIPATSKSEHMVDNMTGGKGRAPDAAMRKRMVSHLESL